MKPLPIFIGTLITLNITACVTGAIPSKIGKTEFPKVASAKLDTGGGNPEVNLNLCLQETYADKIKCLDTIFPSSPTILLIPEADGKRIFLAGRGESVERREITISSDINIMILNIDTKNVKTPLKLNIPTAKDSTKGNNIVFTIPVKDIGNKVTLKDKKGDLVLEYTIIRE